VAKKHLENEPLATGFFGSTFDPNSKNGLLFKMVMRSIKKDLEKQGIDVSKPLDYRNWDEIRAWARNLVN
jgi:menaquinone-dependent protoporphyrinogen oxidase